MIKSGKILLPFFLFLGFAFADNAPELSTRWSLVFQGQKTVRLNCEAAIRENEKMRGLMFRTGLADGRGMIFVYDDEEYLSFWMRNTLIPLSIGFVSSENVLLEIRDMKPLDETPIRSRQKAKYAVEVPLGWFVRNKIKEGSRISIEKQTQ